MAVSFMLRRLVLAAAAGILANTAHPAMAQEASLLTYKGEDRQEKLVAAAKKEGTFTWYTSFAERDIPQLIGPFEKKYGIKVRVWRAGTDKVLQRTLMEANGKRYDVDAIHISAPEMEALQREKIFQPVESPHLKDLSPGAVPKHKEWVSTLLTVFVQAYNTNLVRKEDLPKSYEDLLNPKWKGKLGIEAEDFDWFAAVVTGMGEQKGVKLFRDIVATNGISVRKGHTLLTNMIGAGEVPLGLTVYNYMPETAKKKGAPIEWFAIEPAIARVNGIGIARRAPHPNAAALFYDYMLSPEGQKAMTAMDYVPINTTVESPVKGLKIKQIDPAVSLDQMEKWSKLYDDVILKRGGK
ncbi:iron(III) transport system substrate-binding protein [Noviherbaspirillum humi]|uniref:Iron(III) transport system substrate-binding protein n=1 Tax=Noviherbaspirillum humi TaxID=1688639 RepID=A0A239LIE7_9BURK|nr:extracellular solute-binding protein [Noviherbaspirillum humi]SNT29678.1 iron(III) transport system substrate-binding protein [Noviherbaspirillum humi]